MNLEVFDLDEALAAAEKSCRQLAASKEFVSNLPAVEEKGENEVCSICMEGFDEQQKDKCPESEGNRRVPCGHVYHATCITAWLCRCNSCPLCRSPIFLHCN